MHKWMSGLTGWRVKCIPKAIAHRMHVFLCPEAASYFLYNLIDSMPQVQVQAQEDKLRDFFNKLHAQVHKLY